MMKKMTLLLFIVLLFSFGCSSKKDTTQAKLKINLSNIVNMTSGIGSGGTILFGKSGSGEQFGKVITGAEENLELPNGDWSFYAVMWTNPYSAMMSDTPYCGKSIQKLSGTAATVSLKLTNATCADSDFSGGNYYLDSYNSKNYFARLFVEECEDMGVAGSYGCNADNQGSARSYRLVFKSYKGVMGAPVFGAEKIQGACVPFSGGTNLHSNGLQVNFPTGSSSSMPFVVSLEMYLGSDDCNANDPKGMYTHTFNLGLSGFQPGINRFLVSNPNYCSSRKTTIAEQTCLDYLGTYSAGSCGGYFPMVVDRFLPDSTCQSGLSPDSLKFIKQMVSIPKSIICSGALGSAMATGDNSYAAGKGILHRPYKICNEWQLNQIGETNTLLGSSYDSSHYKLMNNLDMNKASNIPGVGMYAAPACAGDTTNKIDHYHNLNPLDGHLCGSGVTVSNAGFTGVFDGAGYTISNGRISTEGLSQVGFVRLLGTREASVASGVVRRLNFKNLSVRGTTYVGGIAGYSNGEGVIRDIKIDELEVESGNHAGGIVGKSASSGFQIKKARVLRGHIRGVDYIGGLAGELDSSISESMFSGVVTSDNSSTSYFSGGVAGIVNASGSVTSSFSEGLISTHTSYIGGVVGKNYGTLNHVYSTMAISSPRNDPGIISAGGIAAYSDGNINNCFSDTRKMYVGGATFNYSGTVQSGSGGVTNCLTDTSNSSNHDSNTYANLRLNSWIAANFISTAGASWKTGDNDGGIPRLAWETRECLLASNLATVTQQVSTLGRGTSLNPVIICTNDQFLSLNGRSASEYYRLGESINISSWGVSGSVTEGISVFNGQFNGDGKALYGMDINIDNVADSSVGIFKTISPGAKVSNLDLFANRVYVSSDTVNMIGLLSSLNQGEIQNISSYASSVVGSNQIGTIAYGNTNSGVIKNIKLNGAHLVGGDYVGGVTSYNTGRIEGVSANVNIGSPSNSFAVGGITSQNNPLGIIEQTSVRGMFNLTNGYPRNVGGLTGVNYGAVSNSYVSDDMTLNLAITASSEAIGGLVGSSESGSYVANSFFLGKIIGTQSSGDLTSKLDTNSSTDEREIGPIAGKSNGGSITASLSIDDFLLWGQSTRTVSACDDTTNMITVTATPPYSIGALSYHKLSFLVPFTTSGNDVVVSGISFSGKCPANGDGLNLYESHHNFAEYGTVLPISDFNNLAAFSSRGFSIAQGDSSSVLAYHVAKMNKLPLPASTPIWVMEPDDDYPRLLKLDH